MLRIVVKWLLDLGVWLLAVPVAYVIRLDTQAAEHVPDILTVMLLGLPFKAATLVWSGQHWQSWYRTGLRDLRPMLGAVAVVLVVELVFVVFARPESLFFPRSVPLIEAMLAVLAMTGLRFVARLYFEESGILRVRQRDRSEPRRVVIAGAGEAGQMVAREMLRQPTAARRPVGFLDDDPTLQKRTFAGLRVLGTLQDIRAVAARYDADEVLIAMPSADGDTMRRIVEQVRESGLEHRTLPSFEALISGSVTTSSIREVAVDDLLRREPVQLDPEPVRSYLRGRTVLVTGAGGSIGSEIVRQVAAFEPAELVLVGRGENSIFEIDRELATGHPTLRRTPRICDVRDEGSLRALFAETRPHVVFHAAAHKHVPLMEANPEQAVWNNVGGTRNVVALALEYGTERVVNVSTDKAVNPTSVMGATKRIAEQVVADAARRCPEGVAMVSVRFGNVLGSRGSVVPIFREQIARGGPVTITHPDMTRYFMTIPEASQLVLQAGAIAVNGQTYVLDMGEPVRIVDLASDLILLSGLRPERDIEIRFTGIRDGEKLAEELVMDEEGTDVSSHEQILVARSPSLAPPLADGLEALFDAADRRDRDGILAAIRRLVPSFAPRGDNGAASRAATLETSSAFAFTA